MAPSRRLLAKPSYGKGLNRLVNKHHLSTILLHPISGILTWCSWYLLVFNYKDMDKELEKFFISLIYLSIGMANQGCQGGSSPIAKVNCFVERPLDPLTWPGHSVPYGSHLLNNPGFDPLLWCWASENAWHPRGGCWQSHHMEKALIG